MAIFTRTVPWWARLFCGVLCLGVLLPPFLGHGLLLAAAPDAPRPPDVPAASEKDKKQVTLDFNNVDLPVFIQFMSEATGKNFILDEKVRGKMTLFSPAAIAIERAYDIFLSVLDMKGFMVQAAGGDVYQILPVAEAPPERTVQVYPLQHTPAEEVAKVLSGLASGKTAAPARRRLKPSGEIADTVQILADKATNTLIITASDADYAVLKRVIASLDVRRKQVYVEAVVLEVGVDKFKDVGTDLGAAFGYSDRGNAGVIGGINQSLSELPALVEIADKLKISVQPFNVRAFLRALSTASDVNILSTPQILATDNQKAEIVVAQNVPFPGLQSQTSGGNIQTTVERKDVGVTLRLTPTVLENDLVKMDVYQEVSSVVDSVQAVGNVVLGPTTSKRSATTSVIVPHAQAVVIGGLIRDNVIVTERKIPLLGDLPLVGWLFKTRSRRIEKTNLLIFLTPYIVRDQDDLDEIKATKTDAATRFMEEHRTEAFPSRKALLEDLVTIPE